MKPEAGEDIRKCLLNRDDEPCRGVLSVQTEVTFCVQGIENTSCAIDSILRRAQGAGARAPSHRLAVSSDAPRGSAHAQQHRDPPDRTHRRRTDRRASGAGLRGFPAVGTGPAGRLLHPGGPGGTDRQPTGRIPGRHGLAGRGARRRPGDRAGHRRRHPAAAAPAPRIRRILDHAASPRIKGTPGTPSGLYSG